MAIVLGLQISLESAEDSAEGIKDFLLVVDLSENAVSTYTAALYIHFRLLIDAFTIEV